MSLIPESVALTVSKATEALTRAQLLTDSHSDCGGHVRREAMRAYMKAVDFERSHGVSENIIAEERSFGQAAGIENAMRDEQFIQVYEPLTIANLQ
jgi:hypothetical protein